MRTILTAALSAMALMATPVLAQQGTTSPSAGGSGASSGQGAAAQGTTTQSSAQSQATQVSATQMLGKRVKLSQGKKDIGEITDVVVVGGKVQDVVVEVKELKDKPVAVSYTQLTPDGDSYILSMTEAQLQSAPAHQGDKSGAGQGQTTSGASQQKGQQKNQ